MENVISGFAQPINKYRSPLRYPGGKQRALAKIAALLPSSVYEYREPFFGGGSVYFYAKTINMAKQYWINDAFVELISFWRTVQDKENCKRLIDDLQQLKSKYSSIEDCKKYFYEARSKQNENNWTKAKAEKEAENSENIYRQALLFFFFNRVTFSGTTKAGGFSSAASEERFTVSAIERLRPMPDALQETKITNLDFKEVIDQPGDNVFIFLDPPYFTAHKLYGNGGDLHDFDHERLARTLQQTNHRFLVTYDDCAEVRNLYKWANVKSWQLQYGMNNCNQRRESKVGIELFISNY